jgi:hypothetical protein
LVVDFFAIFLIPSFGIATPGPEVRRCLREGVVEIEVDRCRGGEDETMIVSLVESCDEGGVGEVSMLWMIEKEGGGATGDAVVEGVRGVVGGVVWILIVISPSFSATDVPVKASSWLILLAKRSAVANSSFLEIFLTGFSTREIVGAGVFPAWLVRFNRGARIPPPLPLVG